MLGNLNSRAGQTERRQMSGHDLGTQRRTVHRHAASQGAGTGVADDTPHHFPTDLGGPPGSDPHVGRHLLDVRVEAMSAVTRTPSDRKTRRQDPLNTGEKQGRE
ncbi:hypothetical protein Bbelb_261740 [Branchiostoma belcheri]|nr:hypothetical protein Bbelb_261740 [Branchiostoma belcheri]